MKIMKSYLLLGVASAFLLSGNLWAEEDSEPQIGSLFDDVDSGERFDDVKPALPQQNADVANSGAVVELPKVDIDNALAALEQAKAALEDTKQKAADQDEAKKAEIAAEKKKADDAAEHDRLKKITPEDHRKAAEEKILADHQHKFATPLVTSSDGAVEITPTHENEINADQAKQLREMGVGTDIKAELVGQAPMPAANSDDEAPKDQEPKADDAQHEEAKAEPKVDAVDDSNKNTGKKKKKERTAEEQKDHEDKMKAQKEASEAKKAAKEKKKSNKAARKEANRKAKADGINNTVEEDLDTSINEDSANKAVAPEETKVKHKKEKKKITEEEKAKKTEEGKAIRAAREARQKENKDKDYTELLNEGESPKEIEQSN